MRPRPSAVALVVTALLAVLSSVVFVSVVLDGRDSGSTPATTVRATGAVVDTARPAGGRVPTPPLLLFGVLTALAGVAAAPRPYAGAPALVRVPGRSNRRRPVDGRAPPPRLPPLAR